MEDILMANPAIDTAGLHLAFWRDQFTVLGVHPFQTARTQKTIYQLTLHCRGRQVMAYLGQTQAVQTGVPLLGNRVTASLKLLRFPSGGRLIVESLDLSSDKQ
ncbi:hypothetical protein [Marinobacter goseongensis]|uniref:hypothetical protein n=1 Tax=Marinobacter goseongensis TaxID=453838 RepID=UPI002003F31F|nr:hypothetical protein [Marinobacter goseongensis]MCK7552892.1 hypothetical protein [Marinobacter goseongensis]